MAKAGRLVKELMVGELTKALSERSNFFVVSLGPLQAPEADTLRRRLRTVDAEVLMLKRTLAARGVSELKINGGTEELLTGSVAFVIPGEDFVPAAKILAEFAKESQEKITIRGGWVDGQLLNATRFQEVAHLPPKPQLIAQLIAALEAPLADVVWTIERVMGEVAWVLEEASKTLLTEGGDDGRAGDEACGRGRQADGGHDGVGIGQLR